MDVTARVRGVVRALRPVDPEFTATLARRWADLPEPARTPGQALGRHGVRCLFIAPPSARACAASVGTLSVNGDCTRSARTTSRTRAVTSTSGSSHP